VDSAIFLFTRRVLAFFRVTPAKSFNQPDFFYPECLFWSIIGSNSGESGKIGRGGREKNQKIGEFSFQGILQPTTHLIIEHVIFFNPCLCLRIKKGLTPSFVSIDKLDCFFYFCVSFSSLVFQDQRGLYLAASHLDARCFLFVKTLVNKWNVWTSKCTVSPCSPLWYAVRWLFLFAFFQDQRSLYPASSHHGARVNPLPWYGQLSIGGNHWVQGLGLTLYT